MESETKKHPDEADVEINAIRGIALSLGTLKTASARRRSLAFIVDKFIGDQDLVSRIYASARNTDDTVCADHNLRGCKTCWPEVAQ